MPQGRRLQALPHQWIPRLLPRVVLLLGPLLTPQKSFWSSAPSRAKPDAVESIAGAKGRRPFTRSKSLSCGRSPVVLPTVQGAGSKLVSWVTSGIPTPRGDAQPTRRDQSRAIKPGLPPGREALPPGAERFPRFQARSQTPHEPGLGALAPLRRPSGTRLRNPVPTQTHTHSDDYTTRRKGRSRACDLGGQCSSKALRQQGFGGEPHRDTDRPCNSFP